MSIEDDILDGMEIAARSGSSPRTIIESLVREKQAIVAYYTKALAERYIAVARAQLERDEARADNARMRDAIDGLTAMVGHDSAVVLGSYVVEIHRLKAALGEALNMAESAGEGMPFGGDHGSNTKHFNRIDELRKLVTP